MMNTNTTKGIKNPVTLKNILGLIAVLALALVLCAPHVKTPGAKAAVPASAAIHVNVNALSDTGSMMWRT